jgi:hypothetical protein
VNGEAADVVIGKQLAFAGVQTRAHVQAELPDTVTNGYGAADRAARAVEGGEHSVTERLDKSPPVALDLLAYERIVTFEQRAPAPIAQLGGAVG